MTRQGGWQVIHEGRFGRISGWHSTERPIFQSQWKNAFATRKETRLECIRVASERIARCQKEIIVLRNTMNKLMQQVANRR